ncbi:MAG: hypothetical protein ABIK67_01135 [candidate division WOR-3 bacterium]
MENWGQRLKEVSKKSQVLAKRIESYLKTKESAGKEFSLIEKRLNEIKKILADYPCVEIKTNLSTWLTAEAEALKTIKDEFRYKFGSELRDLLAKDGIALKGQLPVLRVGFYTLKLDFELGFATLFWGPEIQTIKSKIPLSVPTIYETIHSFNERIKRHLTPPKDFLKNLIRAYERYTKLNNIPAGEKVLLIDLLSELVLLSQPASFRADPAKDKFREYSRIQFSYDLYNLKQRENFVIGKHRLRLGVATFDATTDKTKSIWVPDNEQGDGTFYSYLVFEPI